VSNFDKIVGKLYENQISQQLGAEVKAPKERVENEEKNKTFDAKFIAGAVAVNGWRRKPKYPEWHISVAFGDTGYENDPGIYGEKDKTKVIEILEEHQRQIALAIQYIKDNFND